MGALIDGRNLRGAPGRQTVAPPEHFERPGLTAPRPCQGVDPDSVWAALMGCHCAGMPNRPDPKVYARNVREGRLDRETKWVSEWLFGNLTVAECQRLHARGDISLQAIARVYHAIYNQPLSVVRWINQFAQKPRVEKGET